MQKVKSLYSNLKKTGKEKIVCPNGCPVDQISKEGDKCFCGETIEKTCPVCNRAYSNCDCESC